mmetsp:Transcript_74420/g.170697  ORF Transcript_74420/g.170697 Transcript_74420/m.170697 type:complete len:405 (-) Transcript_74420:1987-3201(-)
MLLPLEVVPTLGVVEVFQLLRLVGFILPRAIHHLQQSVPMPRGELLQARLDALLMEELLAFDGVLHAALGVGHVSLAPFLLLPLFNLAEPRLEHGVLPDAVLVPRQSSQGVLHALVVLLLHSQLLRLLVSLLLDKLLSHDHILPPLESRCNNVLRPHLRCHQLRRFIVLFPLQIMTLLLGVQLLFVLHVVHHVLPAAEDSMDQAATVRRRELLQTLPHGVLVKLLFSRDGLLHFQVSRAHVFLLVLPHFQDPPPSREHGMVPNPLVVLCKCAQRLLHPSLMSLFNPATLSLMVGDHRRVPLRGSQLVPRSHAHMFQESPVEPGSQLRHRTFQTLKRSAELGIHSGQPVVDVLSLHKICPPNPADMHQLPVAAFSHLHEGLGHRVPVLVTSPFQRVMRTLHAADL